MTRRLLEIVDRDNVGIIRDAGNTFIADDPFGPESVEKLDDDIVHVHVKDLSRTDERSLSYVSQLETQPGAESFRHEQLGKGNVDHGPLFEALANRGYDGYITTGSSVARVSPETVATRTRRVTPIDRPRSSVKPGQRCDR